MLYFFIILLISFLVYYYDYRRNQRGRWFWLIAVTLIFIVLGGLHYRVGFDSIYYERFYNNLRPLDTLSFRYIESSRFAPGFIILASFTKLFDPEPVLLYFIESTFVCGVALWFFVRNSQNPFFALLMFFTFMFTLLIFEQIREAFAVGFFLLAWPAFKSNNWLKWYILSFCAMAFHASATMMLILPIILVPGVRQLFIFGRRSWLIGAAVLAFAFVLKANFGKYIQLLAVTQSMGELTSKYEDSKDVTRVFNIIGILAQFFRQIIYPVFALIFFTSIKKLSNNNRSLVRMEMLTMVSIYISLLAIGVPIVGRYSNYFFFFPIVLVSDWIFNYIPLARKKIRLGFVYWVILFLPMFGIQIYATYWARANKNGTYKTYMAYYPYTSYLDKEKNIQRLRVLRY